MRDMQVVLVWERYENRNNATRLAREPLAKVLLLVGQKGRSILPKGTLRAFPRQEA